MTEGEWMDDRWSMMLSLKKANEQKKKKEKKKKKLFRFVSLPFSPSLLEERRRREKQKLSFSLSPSSLLFPLSLLETNQLDFALSRSFLSLSSPSLHWLSLFFEQIKKNSLGESRRSTVVPKRTSVVDTQRCSSSSLNLEWSDDPSVKANRSDHLNISYFLFIHFFTYSSSMPSECCPLFLIFY